MMAVDRFACLVMAYLDIRVPLIIKMLITRPETNKRIPYPTDSTPDSIALSMVSYISMLGKENPMIKDNKEKITKNPRFFRRRGIEKG
jgi:hypothetical protein